MRPQLSRGPLRFGDNERDGFGDEQRPQSVAPRPVLLNMERFQPVQQPSWRERRQEASLRPPGWVPKSLIPVLGWALDVRLDELIGLSQHKARKRGPEPKPRQHMQCINARPKVQQRFVMQMLETAPAQFGR